MECLVGVDSADTSELYKVNCNDAWNISVKLDKKKANTLFAENYISDLPFYRTFNSKVSVDRLICFRLGCGLILTMGHL